MEVFLSNILSFPTVVFTVLLAFVATYWLVVGLTGINFDSLDGAADGAADGALEGALDGATEGAAEGALEGAMEGAAEGVAEGAADGLLDGAADGVAEGAADGVLDGLEGAAEGAEAIDSVAAAGGMGSILALAGFGTAPFTFVFSILVLISWMASYFATAELGSYLSSIPTILSSGIIFIGSIAVAVPITNVVSRPFAPLMRKGHDKKRSDHLGHSCRIDTGSVDMKFGQATIMDHGQWATIQVRCRDSSSLKRGDEALIVAYDNQLDAYLVEPLVSQSTEEEAEKAKAPDNRAQKAQKQSDFS